QRSLDLAPQMDAVAGKGRASDVAGFGQADRPELDRMLGEEGAPGLLAGAEAAQKTRVALDQVAVGEIRGAPVGLERDHDHRRRRRQIVGVDHLEEMAGEGRELVVELALDARGEKGEALHQALDVGIAAAVALDREPAADLLVLLGEFPGDVAQMAQLVVEVAQRGRVHHASRSAMVACPVSRSTTEVSSKRSGAGSATSSASISKVSVRASICSLSAWTRTSMLSGSRRGSKRTIASRRVRARPPRIEGSRSVMVRPTIEGMP